MSSVAFAPPTRELVLGRYRAVRPLGSGGNGSVWLAQDEQTGLDVALKIIPREGKSASRAEREALAARRLRHDRCVRAYDVGHDSSHVYIAYEYVPGRTFREALRADALSEHDVIEIAAQVLDALAHAHRAGIVHRDVKPSNVLLEDGGGPSARLLDFGLAQFDGADTLTAVGDVPGTLAYISPERLAGADATAASDVWSVGVMLWEALGQRHPFWGLPLQEVARAIETGAPPLAAERPDLPRRLLGAVDGALASDPAERPRASALAADLRAVFRRPERSPAAPSGGPDALSSFSVPLVRERVLPAALAALAAGIGATLLPFWPQQLVAAIVVGAALAAAWKPRLGLAIALAAPVFPLGNEAQSLALAYGLVALCWLVLCWGDARAGLLYVSGPLLAPLGALALVPLAVQPARGAIRRAAQAGASVLAAAVVAGVSGEALPFVHRPEANLGVAPLTPVGKVVSTLGGVLAAEPLLVGATAVLAAVAVALPWARRRSRYGVASIGGALVIATIATGGGLAAVPLVLVVWGIAGVLAAGTGR